MGHTRWAGESSTATRAPRRDPIPDLRQKAGRRATLRHDGGNATPTTRDVRFPPDRRSALCESADMPKPQTREVVSDTPGVGRQSDPAVHVNTMSLDPDRLWRAVETGDERFDGWFFCGPIWSGERCV